MHKLLELIENLRRPRILVRAAKIGMSEYNRDTDLRRIVRHWVHLHKGTKPTTGFSYV